MRRPTGLRTADGLLRTPGRHADTLPRVCLPWQFFISLRLCDADILRAQVAPTTRMVDREEAHVLSNLLVREQE